MKPVSVNCPGPCRRNVYEGGEIRDGQVVVPFADGQQLLTDFAVVSCPLGVPPPPECPNTGVALEEQAERRPERLRQLVKVIRDRAPRAVRLFLPALTANTPVEVSVTWPVPVPDTTYSISITQEFAALVLLGAIRVAVKAGSRTTTGCTLLVGSTRDVADGQAGLHVVATP